MDDNAPRKPRTLYDKIWDDHVVDRQADGTCLLYIDRHLVHEVTSPQAFEGLRMTGRVVRSPSRTLAVVDHNIQTTDRRGGIAEPESRLQVETLAENVREFGIEYYDQFDSRQGIVHIIGPEQGFTLPGTTIVCGDSHTSTHGAFGALAHGIGTSEVEHVLATQTLIQAKAKNMLVEVNGQLPPGVTAKDIILAISRRNRCGGRVGLRRSNTPDEADPGDLEIEGRHDPVQSSPSRAWRPKFGMVAPDEKTFAYLARTPLCRRPVRRGSAAVALLVELWDSDDRRAYFDKVTSRLDIGHLASAHRDLWNFSPNRSSRLMAGTVPRPRRCCR